MDSHTHVGLDFHRVRERSGLDGDGFQAGYRRCPLCIHLFVHPITVHVRTEVQPFLVKLLYRRGDFDREPDDLIRNELFFQRRAGFRPMIDDADDIPAIKTIGRPMIAGVGVVKHRDRHPADGPRAGHG